VSLTRTTAALSTHDPRPGTATRALSRANLARLALAAAAAAALVTVWTPSASAATSRSHHLTAAQRRAEIRNSALAWAYRQHGKGYCYGGDGPSCYDCSGLVMAAYQHAGVSLPHSTYGMLDSGKLREIPERDARPGDLAFYGDGHVELVSRSGTFGALDYGSLVGWHFPSEWWHPTMYFEVG
jgi:peptidoglycan DL-endopeptidase CwlO